MLVRILCVSKVLRLTMGLTRREALRILGLEDGELEDSFNYRR